LICICSIIGWGLGPLSGMSCGGSCVNTDWNCWLRMFVFSTVSVLSISSLSYLPTNKDFLG
jgi:hypothetical protein